MSDAHGSGNSSSASRCRPDWPNRSVVGQACPKAIKLAWIRFFNPTR